MKESMKRKALRAMISADQREDTYMLLSMMLGNGMGLTESIEKLQEIEHTDRFGEINPLQPMLAECRAEVAEGSSFGEAIGGWVTSEEAAMIASGERSGKLREACQAVIKLVRAKSTIVQAVVVGSIYPVFLLLALSVLLYIVSTKLAPVIQNMLRGEEPTSAMAVLLNIGYVTVKFGLPIVALFGLLVAGTIYGMPRLVGKWRLRVESLPAWTGIGAFWQVFKDIQGAIFLANIAMLGKGNVRRLEALELLSASATPYLRERIEGAMRGIAAGESFGVALHECGYEFPSPRAIKIIRTIDTFKEADEQLSEFADRWLARTVATVEARMKRIALVIMLAVAGVGGLMLVTMSDISDIAESQANKY